MEDYCDFFYNRGVEWDWLAFFWALWTEDATYKYNISEMYEIWDGLSSSGYWFWDDLVDEIPEGWDYWKKYEFEYQGDLSGVDH